MSHGWTIALHLLAAALAVTTAALSNAPVVWALAALGAALALVNAGLTLRARLSER